MSYHNNPQVNKNAVNYVITTFLYTLRMYQPYKMMQSRNFFSDFEPKIKQYLHNPKMRIALMLSEDEHCICGSPATIPNKEILAWCLILPPNNFIYAYTKLNQRKKGYASKLFRELKPHFEFEEDSKKQIFMRFSTPGMKNFLLSKSCQEAEPLEIFYKNS